MSIKTENIKVYESSSILDYRCTEQKHFKILYLNSRSIKNKMDELEIIIQDLKVDVLVITETWLSKEEEKYYNFNSFSSIYSSRKERGGGAGIFINDRINFEVEAREEDQLTFIAVKLKNPDFMICSLYRPPKMNIHRFLDFMDRTLESLNESNCEIFFFGDININILSESKEKNN